MTSQQIVKKTFPNAYSTKRGNKYVIFTSDGSKVLGEGNNETVAWFNAKIINNLKQ